VKISELNSKGDRILSFEIFPPKAETRLDTIFDTIEKLKDLKPNFISVTYGAGGSTKGKTIEIASRVKNDFLIESLAHLTAVDASVDDLDEVIIALREQGIENILALRGDIPTGSAEEKDHFKDFRYAYEVVEHIKKMGVFCVGVAAYPEGHPECPDVAISTSHLREKEESGADFAITQLFFDNDKYFGFLDLARSMRVGMPIHAGIMPVLSETQIKKIIDLSNATIPKPLAKIFDKYSGKPKEFTRAGIEYAITQIKGLIEHGVDGIHIYTMNKADEIRQIVEGIR
jgi:methylenetetrahydrofolate reductase (NADPH)